MENFKFQLENKEESLWRLPLHSDSQFSLHFFVIASFTRKILLLVRVFSILLDYHFFLIDLELLSIITAKEGARMLFHICFIF